MTEDVQCSCGRSFPPDGPDGYVPHILADHPEDRSARLVRQASLIRGQSTSRSRTVGDASQTHHMLSLVLDLLLIVSERDRDIADAKKLIASGTGLTKENWELEQWDEAADRWLAKQG